MNQTRWGKKEHESNQLRKKKEQEKEKKEGSVPLLPAAVWSSLEAPSVKFTVFKLIP